MQVLLLLDARFWKGIFHFNVKHSLLLMLFLHWQCHNARCGGALLTAMIVYKKYYCLDTGMSKGVLPHTGCWKCPSKDYTLWFENYFIQRIYNIYYTLSCLLHFTQAHTLVTDNVHKGIKHCGLRITFFINVTFSFCLSTS